MDKYAINKYAELLGRYEWLVSMVELYQQYYLQHPQKLIDSLLDIKNNNLPF